MPRKHKVGYDILIVNSGPEIRDMYLKEGLSETEATKKAQEIHDFMNKATVYESRFWRRVRDNEFTDGLDPDTPEAKRSRYDGDDR